MTDRDVANSVGDRIRKALKTRSLEKHELQIQAMIFAIQNYPLINRTKLMKFIFFVDLFVYNKYGNTLLEDKYLRLPNGPVPKYGYEMTTPNGSSEVDTDYFTMKKVITDSEKECYYYQFTLKPGVTADLSKFNEVQKDLLKLTLNTIKARRTNYLSQYTHQFKLWSSYVDGKTIGLNDFKLTDKEQDQLELFLNTKVFLTPPNKGGFIGIDLAKERDRSIPVLIPAETTSLPVYINDDTGSIISFNK